MSLSVCRSGSWLGWSVEFLRADLVLALLLELALNAGIGISAPSSAALRVASRISKSSVAKSPTAVATSRTAEVRIVATSPTAVAAASTVDWIASLPISASEKASGLRCSSMDPV